MRESPASEGNAAWEKQEFRIQDYNLGSAADDVPDTGTRIVGQLEGAGQRPRD